MPTFGSLFAGIGGLDRGLELAGWTCRWQVEIDPACQSVLERHHPAVERFGDVRTVGAAQLARVDLICGGFPCQGISVAGKRAGLADPRSRLWWEFHRILAELTPRWLLIENVPGLLSSCGCEECRPPADSVDGEEDEEDEEAVAIHTKPEHRGRDLLALVEGLAELGYGWAFRVLDAQYFGVAQRRRRVFVVGHLGEPWSAAGAVLLEPESCGGHPAPRRPAREDVAGTLGGGTPGGGPRPDTDRMTFVPEQTWALQERDGKGPDSSTKDGHLLAYNIFPEHGQGADLRATPTDVSTALSAEGGLKSHERGTRIVYRKATRPHGAEGTGLEEERWEEDDAIDTLSAHGTTTATAVVGFYPTGGARSVSAAEDTAPAVKVGSGLGIPSGPAVVTPIDLRNATRGSGRTGVGTPSTGVGEDGDPSGSVTEVPPAAIVQPVEVTPCLPAFGGPRGTTTNPQFTDQALALTNRTRNGEQSLEIGGDLSYTLQNPGEGGRTDDRMVLAEAAVRRLTPMECERLQGFPDGWTAGQADSIRYRQLGNAVCVPVAEWIGRRLAEKAPGLPSCPGPG